mgnify:CR=1 FL=1
MGNHPHTCAHDAEKTDAIYWRSARMVSARKLWRRTPVGLRMLLGEAWRFVVPFPYSRGLAFARCYSAVMDSEWHAEGALEEVQLACLRDLLDHAYAHVPYYHNLFDSLNLKPCDITCVEHLARLPVLTKNDVRERYLELQADNAKEFYPRVCHTSGSTGEPLEYMLDRRTRLLNDALVQRHFRWCGVGPNDRIAVFRGTLIDQFNAKLRKHWRRVGREMHFSTFDMNAGVMHSYIDILNDFQPVLIRGYPSSLQILSEFITSSRLRPKLRALKAVHTSSETVTKSQRDLIENALGVPLFDWYGHGESTVSAGECEEHKGLHVNSEFGLVELVETDVTTTGGAQLHELVTTSLHNYSMPLIRYQTEDLAEARGRVCPCGRGHRVLDRIIGRRADVIVGVNGVHMAPSSFVHYWKYQVADNLLGVVYTQIVQTHPDRLLVRLVATTSRDNERVIRNKITQVLGDMDTRFEYLRSIPSGQKWRFTVSNLA